MSLLIMMTLNNINRNSNIITYKNISSSDSQPGDKGFTLFEIMVALAIIAIALVSVLDLQSQSISLATEAKYNTIASFLARQKIAEVRATDGEDLIQGSGDFAPNYPDYTWEVSVYDAALDYPLDEIENLKQIEINIFWNRSDEPKFSHKLYRFVPQKS